jgi:MFS transporter, DHA2 family, multidrug resistance protein
VLGSLAAAVFTARTGQETLGGALAHAGSLESGAGDALATASREAFVVGMQGAAALGAAVLALTAVGAWRLLRAAASAEREPVGV